MWFKGSNSYAKEICATLNLNTDNYFLIVTEIYAVFDSYSLSEKLVRGDK